MLRGIIADCLGVPGRLRLLIFILLAGTFSAFAEEPALKYDADRGEYKVFVEEPVSLKGFPPEVKSLFKGRVLDVVLLYSSIPDEKVAIRSAVREAKTYSPRALALETSRVHVSVMIGSEKGRQAWWDVMKILPENAAELQRYFREVPKKPLGIQLNVETGVLTLQGRPLQMDVEAGK